MFLTFIRNMLGAQPCSLPPSIEPIPETLLAAGTY